MDSAVINIKDGVNGYVDLVKHVLEHGKETAPRGQKTREIEDAVIRIADPVNTLPLNVGRGTVPGIGTKLDVNHYFGSDEQLAAEWAAGPPAKAA